MDSWYTLDFFAHTPRPRQKTYEDSELRAYRFHSIPLYQAQVLSKTPAKIYEINMGSLKNELVRNDENMPSMIIKVTK
jgi:hypothetical protein